MLLQDKEDNYVQLLEAKGFIDENNLDRIVTIEQAMGYGKKLDVEMLNFGAVASGFNKTVWFKTVEMPAAGNGA